MSSVPLALVARIKRFFCMPRRALGGLHEPALTSGGLGARVASEFAKTFQRDLRTTSEAFVSGGFFVGRTPTDSVPEVRILEGGTASSADTIRDSELTIRIRRMGVVKGVGGMINGREQWYAVGGLDAPHGLP
jgi:hypothetical protein